MYYKYLFFGICSWRAAELLCQFLIDSPELLHNKRVCELGAGLGLVSIIVNKIDCVSSGELLIKQITQKIQNQM